MGECSGDSCPTCSTYLKLDNVASAGANMNNADAMSAIHGASVAKMRKAKHGTKRKGPPSKKDGSLNSKKAQMHNQVSSKKVHLRSPLTQAKRASQAYLEPLSSVVSNAKSAFDNQAEKIAGKGKSASHIGTADDVAEWVTLLDRTRFFGNKVASLQ